MSEKKISLIVPVYYEEEVLPIAYPRMKSSLEATGYDYEIIFVNDGSKDRTVEACLKLKEQDPNIVIVSFARNFGKEAAMLAGFRQAKGDYVVVMDVDLQDPPSLLPKLYDLVTKEGYDSAATYRVTRAGEPKIRSFFARAFYKIINKMIEVEIVDGARDYRIMQSLKKQLCNQK